MLLLVLTGKIYEYQVYKKVILIYVTDLSYFDRASIIIFINKIIEYRVNGLLISRAAFYRV